MVTERGQLRLPSTWSALPSKSSAQGIAADRGAQAQADVAVASLEHVLGRALAVGEIRERGAGAPLGVVEDLVGRRSRSRSRAVSRRQLPQPADPGQVRGALGAQVGEPLARVAHLAGEVGQDRVIGAGRAGSRRPPRRAVTESAGMPPGVGPADVGVVGAARGEPESARLPSKTG